MKKVLLPLLMLIFFCSCSGISGASVNIQKKQYETDTLKVYTEIPKFSRMKNTIFQDELNKEYSQNNDNWINQFQTDAQQMGSSDVKYVLEVRQNLRYNNNNFISIVTEAYQFTGGAHGTTNWFAKNIDDNQGKVITLPDLFQDDQYKTILNRKMQEIIDENKDAYKDLWEKPMITDNQGFYIEDGKLVIYYPPYELSYYARGFVEFKIPLKSIEGYLKGEYKRLI